jgi:cytidylate kinase
MKIALCGYLGSGCTEVAEILAGDFGLETFNTSRILGLVENFNSLSVSGEINIDGLVKDKLDEILKRDNLIIEGRSAFMILNRKDVLRIFLDASFEERMKHVAERRGISAEEAKDDVTTSDDERNHLFQRLYGKNCTDVSNYDFTLNTGSRTHSRVAKIIADVIKGYAS